MYTSHTRFIKAHENRIRIHVVIQPFFAQMISSVFHKFLSKRIMRDCLRAFEENTFT